MNVEDYAQKMFEGHSAKSCAEDMIDAFWPDKDYVDHIGVDGYDTSIEIYFTKETPLDLEITCEHAAVLASMGFQQGWCNFADGTEQYWGINRETKQTGVGGRRKVNHPRWLGGDPVTIESRKAHAEAK